jgi:hypothetical protein
MWRSAALNLFDLWNLRSYGCPALGHGIVGPLLQCSYQLLAYSNRICYFDQVIHQVEKLIAFWPGWSSPVPSYPFGVFRMGEIEVCCCR